jgi:type II secretory pathway component PulK
VLFVVLFFVLLLASSIATFLRRVAIDAGIATQRDRALRAEALARGGVRLAQAVLLEDLRLESGGEPPDSLHDPWARLREVNLVDDPDVELRVEVEDAAARLNLNALAGARPVAPEGSEETSGQDLPGEGSELGGGAEDLETRKIFLSGFLERVIEGMPGRPEDKLYDATALAEALIDWVDPDEVSIAGGLEDEPYQARTPPHRAANRPLLSFEELRLVDGFDGALVEALRPYVTVYPLVGGEGVNLNTAPSWVLAQLTRGTDVSGMRPVEPDDVERVVQEREERLVCSAEAEGADCVPVTELFEGESVEPAMRDRSDVFVVRAVARVVDVERRVETVIDRSTPSQPLRLSWRVE